MKHFCTFGNTPKYNKALNRIFRQSKESGYFNTVSIYHQNNTPGIEKHVNFIKTQPRGYGNRLSY